MISDGAAEAIKEDDAMSVFFMDFDMAPSVIWARDLYDQMQIRSDFRKWFPPDVPVWICGGPGL